MSGLSIQPPSHITSEGCGPSRSGRAYPAARGPPSARPWSWPPAAVAAEGGLQFVLGSLRLKIASAPGRMAGAGYGPSNVDEPDVACPAGRLGPETSELRVGRTPKTRLRTSESGVHTHTEVTSRVNEQVRTDSLPCELRLVTRITVAHTESYQSLSGVALGGPRRLCRRAIVPTSRGTCRPLARIVHLLLCQD